MADVIVLASWRDGADLSKLGRKVKVPQGRYNVDVWAAHNAKTTTTTTTTTSVRLGLMYNDLSSTLGREDTKLPGRSCPIRALSAASGEASAQFGPPLTLSGGVSAQFKLRPLHCPVTSPAHLAGGGTKTQGGSCLSRASFALSGGAPS